MKNCQLLSIVIPLHNEEDTFAPFLAAMQQALQDWTSEVELLFVDDGSSDQTWMRVCQAAQTESQVQGLRFTRNFGKEAAILAGLEAARGEWVIVMDGDGQHPPSMLPQILNAATDETVGIVAARKSARTADGWLARMFAKHFNRFMLAATGLDLDGASDFRLMKRAVIDTLLRMPEKIRFFRAMTVWTGFKQIDLPFDVQPRLAGTTSWTTGGLIKLAVTGITAFSAKPLTAVFRLGLLGIFISFLLAVQALWSWITGVAISGWTSLTLIIIFFGSANLLGIGILGAYLAQIFDEIKARPVYLVGERVTRKS